ncbi:MAG: ACP S-malonyltransferase [Kofleriaceae bacterium]|nr:ACP S-malonyltransferase [Kofleriaceae bacterium]
MKTALLFPGQGSQRVGMGRDLFAREPIAKAVFQEADEALGFALSDICFDGPEDTLTLTANTQPAILTTSIAVLRVLLTRGLTFDVVAGHSLGEWTALVAAGSLSLADAVRLTHLRGKFMQEAVPVGVGSMAALMGLSLDATNEVCKQASAPGQPVETANLNGGGQIVISGHDAAIDRAIPLAKAAGAKRAVKLSVSAPFHCSMMAPAAEQLAQALASINVQAPKVPVVSNVAAQPNLDAGRIKALLVQQVTGAVRWEESITWMAQNGVVRAYELGSGAVLKGLVKRIAETITVTTIGEPHEVDAFTA